MTLIVLNRKIIFSPSYTKTSIIYYYQFSLIGITQDEEIAILRGKIQQLEILCCDLRNELNSAKSDNMQTSGMQSGLRHRLVEQDNTILEIKSENLNLMLMNQQLVKGKDEMSVKLEEQAAQIKRLEAELAKRDDLIVKVKMENKSLAKENENAKYVSQQVKHVTETLDIVQEKEVI